MHLSSLLLLCLPLYIHAQILTDPLPPPAARTAPPSYIGFAVEWFAINRFTLAKPYANPVAEINVLSPVTVNVRQLK